MVLVSVVLSRCLRCGGARGVATPPPLLALEIEDLVFWSSSSCLVFQPDLCLSVFRLLLLSSCSPAYPGVDCNAVPGITSHLSPALRSLPSSLQSCLTTRRQEGLVTAWTVCIALQLRLCHIGFLTMFLVDCLYLTTSTLRYSCVTVMRTQVRASSTVAGRSRKGYSSTCNPPTVLGCSATRAVLGRIGHPRGLGSPQGYTYPCRLYLVPFLGPALITPRAERFSFFFLLLRFGVTLSSGKLRPSVWSPLIGAQLARATSRLFEHCTL